MKIYNTYSNKVEDFKPIESGKIKMYVCGPTVYNYIHIGNARPVIFFDTVRRYFIYRGYDVKFASNLTDVNDKIYLQTLKENIDEHALADKYSKAFIKDVESLNALPFDYTPSVREYMDQIIQYVETLIKKDFAYEVDGDVYFRVNMVEEYGQLSGQKVDDLISGARVDVNEKKENPLDFMLWKRNTEGETFVAPFGDGRPGWHTECSAMIEDIFGGMIDIHGGGTDLRFPHHENELAQTKALRGRGIAQVWMHNGRIDLNDSKMSKSIGNLIFVKDLLEKVDASAYRLLVLSSGYRSPINYTDELMKDYIKEFDKIKRAYKNLHLEIDLLGAFDDELVDEESINSLIKAMENDFNTPNVITGLQALVKNANIVTRSDFTKEDILRIYNTMNVYLYVLGLKIDTRKLTKEEKGVYVKWRKAREDKDFSLADEYRSILREKGIL